MLIDQAKKLPDSPGVYIFFDKSPLYVGRTVSLRKRVLSYFKNDDPRLREMVGLAKEIKHIKTDTLLEAIILEANLIKKYWPKYNVKDRDNKSFIYIVIPRGEFPHPFIVRERELGKLKNGEVFGPYQGISTVESALRIIRRIFPYSTCVSAEALAKVGKPGKPCFDYQIGLCPGACIGKISNKDYMKNIKSIIMLLKGEKKRLINKLKKENPLKARALSHIQDVSLLQREELTSDSLKIEAYDISHLSGKEPYGSMVVFVDNKPDKSLYRLFKIKTAPQSDDLRALEEVLTRRLKHKEWSYPDLIVIDGGKPQVDFVFRVLEKTHIPIVGISKYANDKLVYPSKSKKSIKNLAENLKSVLLKAREEAHRFSRKSSRRKRRIL